MTADISDFRPEHGKKLAQRLAEQIEKEIITAGWPVGRSLGKEADLLARYPVSRAVLREAIAIVEQDGIAQMRRGTLGGLSVIAPAANTVVLALRNYLEAAGVTLDELVDAREAIEALMLQLAAQKMDPAAMIALQQMDAQVRQTGSVTLAFGRELLRSIADTADNPLLSMLVAVLAQVGVSLTFYHGVSEKQIAQHLATTLKIRHTQIEALIANDLPGLIASMKAQSASLRGLHVSLPKRRRNAKPLARDQGQALMQRLLDMGEINRKVKLADVVSLQLQAMIIQRGWPVGERLGAEAELVDALGVSRGVLREAIRGLERLGVVKTVSGRYGGGLHVAEPNPAQTIRRALLYFGHQQLSMSAIREVDETVSLAAVTALSNAVAREGAQLLEPLRSAVAQVNAVSVEAYMRSCYLTLAELCGNRVLTLFMHILAELVTLGRPQQDTHINDKQLARKLKNLATIHCRFIDAIDSGQVNIARRWMIELRKLVTQENPVSRSASELVDTA